MGEEKDITPISTKSNDFIEGNDAGVQCANEIDHSLDQYLKDLRMANKLADERQQHMGQTIDQS